MMPRAQRRRLAVVLLAWSALAWDRGAHAECAIAGAACEELRSADMVFFGEVVDVDWESIGRAAATGTAVRCTVIEVFKGDPPRDLSVDLTTWSEEKRFAFGQRAIVYLKKSGANWTSACRRLHYAAGVDDLEVSWLRKMRDGSPGGQVFGTIASSTDPTRSNLRQIRVRLVQQGRPIAETRTEVA